MGKRRRTVRKIVDNGRIIDYLMIFRTAKMASLGETLRKYQVSYIDVYICINDYLF